jgi:hypothetical protein
MEQEFLEQFKTKRETWIQCLSGEDRNSIFKHIHHMVWNASVFKVVNEARNITPENEKGEMEINGMVSRFINKCFFDSQLLAIRRLTEASYELQDTKNGVYSLSALLNDIKDNIELMTRENFFAVENLEYDYEALHKLELEYIFEQQKDNPQDCCSIPPELNSWRVKSRHEVIDTLAGVTEGQRKPSDAIRTQVVEYLLKMLKDVSADMKLYVDKYIAHLATPESRDYDKAEEVSITLGHLWSAHKVICQVANFIDKYMLTGISHGFLPLPQFSHLRFIDKPLVSESNIKVLSNAWDDYFKETNSWGSWGIKEFCQEMDFGKQK